MKTIKVTFLSSRDTVQMECAQLMEQNPDIELVSIPPVLTQLGYLDGSFPIGYRGNR